MPAWMILSEKPGRSIATCGLSQALIIGSPFAARVSFCRISCATSAFASALLKMRLSE